MSRLGPTPAAGRRVAIAKPKNDVYVALLAIALGALFIACILLFLEFNRYGSVRPKTTQATPASSPVLARLLHGGFGHLEGSDSLETSHVSV